MSGLSTFSPPFCFSGHTVELCSSTLGGWSFSTVVKVVVYNGLGSLSKWVKCHALFFHKIKVFRDYMMASD